MATEQAQVKQCKVEGCKRPYQAKGYCVAHYHKWKQGELPKPRYKICNEEKCRKPTFKAGLCEDHYKTKIAAKAAPTAAAPEAPKAEEAPKEEKKE